MSVLSWLQLSSLFLPGRGGGDAPAFLAHTASCEPLSPSSAAHWIRDGRYAAVLAGNTALEWDPAIVDRAWEQLRAEMAMVPEGAVTLGGALDTGSISMERGSQWQVADVPALYIDRCAVSNADYARFVDSGGYHEMHLWPEEIWPGVLHFADATGRPGPKYWSGGRPPKGRAKHPVVGVCWYEAMAYARWAGKRLPTAAQWQRAGTWHSTSDPSCGQLRFPWGNGFDPKRANTYAAGRGETAPVDAYPSGCTPNGVFQLVGNTWEWVATLLDWESPNSPLNGREGYAEVRGGAFDTYLDSQVTCQFRSAQKCLFRGANVGFRCCVDASQLPQHTQHIS